MSERRIYLVVDGTRLSARVSIGVPMIIHDNEVLGPEHLAELGTIFYKTWTAFASSANSEEYIDERAHLASILLRLYGLRQLGPDQIMQTALRLLKPSSPVAMSANTLEADSSGRQPQSVRSPTSV